ELPPQRIGRCPWPRRLGAGRAGEVAGGEPGAAGVLRMDGVHTGQRDQQKTDPDPHRQGRDGQSHGRLFAAAQGEANTETDHVATRSSSSAVTLPSRTTTSRSAYAAQRASWVTRTIVVACCRAAPTRRSITCSPVKESRDPVGSSAKTTSGSVT